MTNSDPIKDLPLPQRRALEALAGGQSKAAAAAAAGVRVRQVNRYLESPQFRAALDAATGAAIGSVTRRMVGTAEGAVGVIVSLASDPQTPASVRLRAAIAVLELGIRFYEAQVLEQRIAALERRL
jgi:hypothetical protein